jgi:hypothetical protein
MQAFLVLVKRFQIRKTRSTTAWKVSFIAELAPGCLAIKLPIDFDSCAIHSAVPGTSFPTQLPQVGILRVTEALTRQEADFISAWFSQLT